MNINIKMWLDKNDMEYEEKTMDCGNQGVYVKATNKNKEDNFIKYLKRYKYLDTYCYCCNYEYLLVVLNN